MGWQRLKVYTPDGTYIASCKYMEDAATIVLHHGAGASVRLGYSKWPTIYSLPEEFASHDTFESIVQEMEEGRARIEAEQFRRYKADAERRRIEHLRMCEVDEATSDGVKEAYRQRLIASGWGRGQGAVIMRAIGE